MDDGCKPKEFRATLAHLATGTTHELPWTVGVQIFDFVAQPTSSQNTMTTSGDT
jgi:hypothetical protein